jgi:hypothetical protein
MEARVERPWKGVDCRCTGLAGKYRSMVVEGLVASLTW